MAIATDNYKLAQLELTNSANFPLLLNNTFKTIDKGLTLDVGTSTGTGNNYVLNLGSITLSSSNKGISFKFWADKDSNGAVTINGTYHLVKANGNPIKNIKRNAPYTITYDGGTNFFLSSGGADESDSTTVGTDGSKVLEGETFIGSDGEIHTGTMPNIGHQTATINAGGKVVISKGYHDGTGYIQSNSMGTQLSNLGVTLTSASQLVSGVKAVNKNGSLITGTATIQSLGGKEYKTGSNVATTQHVWGSGSYRVMSYVDNFRVIAGKISYKDKIFVYINDSSICSYPITVCWNNKNSQYSVGTASNEFSPSQPDHVGIPVFYDSTNNNSIVVTNYIAWE